MLTVDANVILRLILNDNDEMVEKARTQLLSDTFFIKREVIAEVIYVLSGVYKTERKDVARTILEIMETDGIFIESENIVRYAMNVYQTHTLDFLDCMLHAYQSVENEEAFTFDQKLQRLLNRK